MQNYNKVETTANEFMKKILNSYTSINYKDETLSAGVDTNIIIDCYKYMISNYIAATIYKKYDLEEAKRIIANLNKLNLTDLIKVFNPEDYINEVKKLTKNKKM